MLDCFKKKRRKSQITPEPPPQPQILTLTPRTSHIIKMNHFNLIKERHKYIRQELERKKSKLD